MRNGLFGALLVALTSATPVLGQASPFVKLVLTGHVAEEDNDRKDDLGPMPPADGVIAKPGKALPATEGPKLPLDGPAHSLSASSSCGDACCDPCCQKEPRFWGDMENLCWWLKHGPLPVPLVSTGPAASLGVLGNGGSVLFGNTGLNDGELDGIRVNAGAWLNDCRTIGVEGGFFMLEQGTTGFAAKSDATGNPVLTIPFVNAQTGTGSGAAVGLPGAFAGSVAVTSSSRFYGSNLDGVYNAYRKDGLSIDGLAGFRYLNLEERLGVQRSATTLAGGTRFFLGANVPGTSTANFADEFDTQDQFFGGELGARVNYKWNKLTATVLAKAALGGNLDSVNSHGDTTLLQPGLPSVTVPGGLLTGPFNSGRAHDSPLSWSPEVRGQIGYQLTDHIRVFAGYTWMYWNEIARPGNQIDTSVNLTQFSLSPTFGPLNGPARPTLMSHDSGFWAQGADVGVGFSY